MILYYQIKRQVILFLETSRQTCGGQFPMTAAEPCVILVPGEGECAQSAAGVVGDTLEQGPPYPAGLRTLDLRRMKVLKRNKLLKKAQ